MFFTSLISDIFLCAGFSAILFKNRIANAIPLLISGVFILFINVKYEILLAELFYELGEHEKAVKKYEELIKSYEENDQVKISMIKYYSKIENYREMLDLVDSILINEYSGIEVKFNLVVSLITDNELLPDIQESLEQIL